VVDKVVVQQVLLVVPVEGVVVRMQVTLVTTLGLVELETLPLLVLHKVIMVDLDLLVVVIKVVEAEALVL
tara:strand:- start:341 stop:550 length:210 start_codon:yes stop_codon:yes gene_type:complete